MIPISFIKSKIQEYDALIDYELYEEEDDKYRKFYYMKRGLLELLHDWEKFNRERVY